jgi:hypothetical protein
MARFEREAQMLAAQNHPNIATVYGIEQGALVMELVEGADLKGPLPLEEAIAIARQIAAGLEAAHEKGIIHRDLKPANIKLTPAGVVKILDFGLAKSASESSAASGGNATISPTLSLEMTRAGMILGTAAYMSPEQARGKQVDKRTDIWAFGVVLYEILTGKRLFVGDDVTETLASVVKDKPDLSGFPSNVRRLLERCLERDPKKRLRDIGEAPHYLDEPASTTTSDAPHPAGRLLVPWSLATLAMVAAVAGFLWKRPADEPSIRSYILPAAGSAFARLDGNHASLSPDGKRLAFTASAPGGKVMIWVRSLDSESAQPLAGTDDAVYQFWSPDSRSLGFFAGGKLKRIDAGGGTVTVLADASSPRGGTWSRGDFILYAPVLMSPIMRIPSSGGTPVAITHIDHSQNEISHRWPSALPDGKHFLFTSRARGVYVASVDGSGSPQRILTESSNAVYSSGNVFYAHIGALLGTPFDPARGEFTGPPIIVTQSAETSIEGSDFAPFSTFWIGHAGVLFQCRAIAAHLV